MAKTSVSKICSRECEFFKQIYRPYYSSECKRINDGWYHDTKSGKYCNHFKQRMRFVSMFKVKSKTEIIEMYIKRLQKENKDNRDRVEIALLEEILNVKSKEEEK